MTQPSRPEDRQEHVDLLTCKLCGFTDTGLGAGLPDAKFRRTSSQAVTSIFVPHVTISFSIIGPEHTPSLILNISLSGDVTDVNVWGYYWCQFWTVSVGLSLMSVCKACKMFTWTLFLPPGCQGWSAFQLLIGRCTISCLKSSFSSIPSCDSVIKSSIPLVSFTFSLVGMIGTGWQAKKQQNKKKPKDTHTNFNGLDNNLQKAL